MRRLHVERGPALRRAASLDLAEHAPLRQSWRLRLRVSCWLSVNLGGLDAGGIWLGWRPPMRFVWLDPTGEPKIGGARTPLGVLLRMRRNRRRARATRADTPT